MSSQSLLGQYIRSVRVQRELSLGDLARLIGYQNVSKGANRLARLEQAGEAHDELLNKVVSVLCIDADKIEKLAAEDRRRAYAEWSQWASEPIQPYVVVRLLAAVLQQRALPPDVTTAERAELFASSIAKTEGRRVCLVLSRRLSIWFDGEGQRIGVTEGQPDKCNEPAMRVGRHKFVL